MFNRSPPLLLAVLLLSASGCGGSSAGRSAPIPSAEGVQQGAGALAADARSAATGDIPDTQNFLTLLARRLRVSMLYPEGWTVRETASQASITDKNNLVRIAVSKGSAPTLASVQALLGALKTSVASLTVGTPHAITLKSGAAVRVTYRTQSAPNPVTGKQVTLVVERYALGHGGRVAIVDLGTPVGVDNVDAYRRMIESFTWR